MPRAGLEGGALDQRNGLSAGEAALGRCAPAHPAFAGWWNEQKLIGTLSFSTALASSGVDGARDHNQTRHCHVSCGILSWQQIGQGLCHFVWHWRSTGFAVLGGTVIAHSFLISSPAVGREQHFCSIAGQLKHDGG